ncbi:hypothetical protein AUP68_12351 [Ilyonectria robusta]
MVMCPEEKETTIEQKKQRDPPVHAAVDSPANSRPPHESNPLPFAFFAGVLGSDLGRLVFWRATYFPGGFHYTGPVCVPIMPSRCERHPCVTCRPEGIPTAHAHVGTDLVAAAMQRSTLAATRTRPHQRVSASGCEHSRCSRGLEVSSHQTAWQSRVSNALPSWAIADLTPGYVGGRYLPETSVC